jgi:Na+-transporting methylmalonyl-CoA/oxaloacetate decarboxylase gamma subunit
MSIHFTPDEMLYAFPIMIAGVMVCFIFLSIFVFVVTGKSLLWRINHWLKTPTEAPKWLINMDPGVQVNKIADKYHDHFYDFKKLFKAEVEAGKYEDMNNIIYNGQYTMFDFDKLFDSDDYLKVKIGWAYCTDNPSSIVPAWYFYENGKCYLADTYRMCDANVYILFLAGIYEKPMYRTYRKYHKYIIYP